MSAGKLTPERSSEGVAEHVRNDGSGNARGGSHDGQFGAKFAQQRATITAARQEQPVRRDGAERAEETQSVDQLADGVVNRHQTFSVQLAQRHMERPLSGSEQTQSKERSTHSPIRMPV